MQKSLIYLCLIVFYDFLTQRCQIMTDVYCGLIITQIVTCSMFINN